MVTEVGAGLRAYSAGGRELLDGYGADETSPSGRGQVLIPWPNRIQDGSYEFDGRQHQLPINDVPEQDAIHGLVRWRPGPSASASRTASSCSTCSIRSPATRSHSRSASSID